MLICLKAALDQTDRSRESIQGNDLNLFCHLKMTALSYSWTTLTTKRRETGSETTMRSSEPMVMMSAQMPGPSSQTGKHRKMSCWFFGGNLKSQLKKGVRFFAILKLPRKISRSLTQLCLRTHTGSRQKILKQQNNIINLV